MRGILASLLLTCLATQADAGAWPRERGTTFLSFSQYVSTGTRTLLTPYMTIDNFSSLYAEYGLTDKWTVGLNAGFGGDAESSVQSGYVFARYPVWASDNGYRLAAELGIGLLEDETDGRQNRIRPGLSWGYGFATNRGDGWAGIEASADYRHPTGDVAYKADFTVGLKPTDKWMLILQVQSGLYPDAEPLVRIAPSVVRKTGERGHLQLGAFGGVTGDDSVGGKLALWFSF